MTGHKGQVAGYVRVSAIDQNEARQVAAIGEVDRLFLEKVSGKNVDDRKQLKEMLAYVREGHVVRVTSPDRLSRSTRDLLDLIAQMAGKGVEVEFVDNPALNTNTAQGEFMLTILAAVAQLERATIRERQIEGIAIAKANGVYERAPKLTDEKIAPARERIEVGVPKGCGGPRAGGLPADALHGAGRPGGLRHSMTIENQVRTHHHEEGETS